MHYCEEEQFGRKTCGGAHTDKDMDTAVVVPTQTQTWTHRRRRRHSHSHTHAHTHARARAHTHTRTHPHTHTRTHTHARTRAHTHTRARTRTHTHTHTHTEARGPKKAKLGRQASHTFGPTKTQMLAAQARSIMYSSHNLTAGHYSWEEVRKPFLLWDPIEVCGLP
jgi:hypothetical protein